MAELRKNESTESDARPVSVAQRRRDFEAASSGLKEGRFRSSDAQNVISKEPSEHDRRRRRVLGRERPETSERKVTFRGDASRLGLATHQSNSAQNFRLGELTESSRTHVSVEQRQRKFNSPASGSERGNYQSSHTRNIQLKKSDKSGRHLALGGDQEQRSERVQTSETPAASGSESERYQRDTPSGLISLVDVGHNNKFIVNDNVLVELMHRQELLDRPLVIISISGAFRSGKSFIMNFFIRYLSQHGWENQEWFGTDSTEISPNFLWKRGSKACTKGIHIYPEIFHVPLNDGRTAAVLLVDTQGLYDGDTSPDLNAKIMSVSTLFCSHQILNILHQVDERDLEHLELCTEFAKVAADLRGDKPFQSLSFLIRDWEREYECPFGESTDRYLEEFLRKPSQSKEVAKIRKYISSAFEELCCFLLPHPGKDIPRFEKGTLTNKAMDKEFQFFTKILVERILHPNNIAVKKCKDGREATADDLLHLIGAVGKAYKLGKVPTAETMLKSMVRANHTNSLGQAVLHYKGIMKELCGGLMGETSLLECHGSALKEAETRFRELATMGDEVEKEDFFRQLQRECGDAFSTIKERNKGRKKELLRVLESSIDDIASVYKDSIQQVPTEDESGFKQLETEQRQQAFDQFDTNSLELKQMMGSEIDRLKRKLREKLNGIYKDVDINRERERSALAKKKTDDCDKCMNAILKDFRLNVDQHEDSYVENLQTILEDLKQKHLTKYDNKMASNSEREYVEKNKGALERDMKYCIKQAMLVNKNRKLAKISRLQNLASECRSDYRENINAADLESLEECHESHKQKVLQKFDSECESSVADESMKLRITLERDINFIYDNVKTEMERDRDAQVQAAKGAIIFCRNKVFKQFQVSVDKYGSQYHEDLEDRLGKEKEDKLRAYDGKLTSNSEQNSVQENRQEMSDEMDEYMDKAFERNEDRQLAKKSRLRYLVSECKSDYRENMNAADLESLEEDHITQKQKALEKFDFECKSSDAESRELRNGLERDIGFIYNQLKSAMERERVAQVQAAEAAIISCRNKFFKQFQASVDKYGNQYYEDLEENLEKEKEDKLRAYEKELNSNTERNAVQENKQDMSYEMDDYIDKALERNEDQQKAKISRLRVLLMECRSNYRENVYGADLGSLEGNHRIYKQRALEKFDSECESSDAEATKLRKELEHEIVVIYKDVKTAMQRDHNVQVQITIGEITSCRNEVYKQFQASVDKYGHEYHEDLERLLDDEKEDMLGSYDEKLKQNTEQTAVLKNRQSMSQEMDTYIRKAFQKNENQMSLAEREYEKYGFDLADRFEENLSDVLVKASVDPRCIDESCDDFLESNVFNNSRYKSLPKWGQEIVQEAVTDRAVKLKEQVERNKDHREAKVDDSSLFKKGWRAFKKGVKKVVKKVTSIFR